MRFEQVASKSWVVACLLIGLLKLVGCAQQEPQPTAQATTEPVYVKCLNNDSQTCIAPTPAPALAAAQQPEQPGFWNRVADDAVGVLYVASYALMMM